MKRYNIALADGPELGCIRAENAREALVAFCLQHPDDDIGYRRGGLNCDADTYGGRWASVKTDGGRITATALDEGEV